MTLSRRSVLAALAASPVTAGCVSKPTLHPSAAPNVAPHDLRIVSVPTSIEGGLLPALLEDYHGQTGTRVTLFTSPDVYDTARAGGADLVISHYGHKQAEAFVTSGYGMWPKTVFSNQLALMGPPEDPAGVRGLTDLVEAFRRIATKPAPFLVNGIDGVRYLAEVLWNAAGKPSRAPFWIDQGIAKAEAAQAASDLGAYILWGLTPFTRLHGERGLRLEPLVVLDPLLERLMVSVVVRKAKVPNANEAAALLMEDYLLAPATQARIREIHYPGSSAAPRAPGGRNNRASTLPKG